MLKPVVSLFWDHLRFSFVFSLFSYFHLLSIFGVSQIELYLQGTIVVPKASPSLIFIQLTFPFSIYYEDLIFNSPLLRPPFKSVYGLSFLQLFLQPVPQFAPALTIAITLAHTPAPATFAFASLILNSHFQLSQRKHCKVR